MNTECIAIRVQAANVNHHLWNNNGTYWCHYTVHRPDCTKQRIRRSLGTGDAEQARRLRDGLLDRLRSQTVCVA